MHPQLNVFTSAEPQAVRACHAVYSACLPDWPLSLERFSKQLLQISHPLLLTYEVEEKICGFLLGASHNSKGSILCLCVEPEKQRQGIATGLLAQAETMLHESGCRIVATGSGTPVYFWPGVPQTAQAAVRFFQRNGFKIDSECEDLVMEKNSFVNKPATFTQVSFLQATPADSEAVISFEHQHFPNWEQPFRNEFQRGGDVFIARHKGEIVGSVIAVLPNHPDGIFWRHLFNGQVGGLGALGVHDDMRRKGIGLELSRLVTEFLFKQGTQTSFVGWTWVGPLYEALGYKSWRKYQTLSKILA